jgi:LPPG:FO 2-phospho-L-lactate transferase
VTAASVAAHYAGLLRGFVLDEVDAELKPSIESDTLQVLVTNTVMRSDADRARLAREVLDFAIRDKQ